ncbi:MAG: hypothetical protein HQK51_01315 [Oligoflexia bacterium]|nr:hypothetical protein [Oligoflexia bacterium]
MNIKSKTLFIFLFLFLTLTYGCSKNNDTAIPASRFTNLYENTFKPNCIRCHVPGQDPYDNLGVKLDFSTKEKAHSTLTTLKCAGQSSTFCADIPYVTARDLNQSYLVAILNRTYNNITNYAGKVNCVPYNIHIIDQHLTTEEQNSIIAWINEGAAI